MKLRVIVFILVVLALIKAEGPNLDDLRGSITVEEQRAFIKVNVLLDTAHIVVSAQLQTAVAQGHMSQTQVYFWYNKFKDERRTDITDLPRSGRPREATNEENQEKVRQLILESEGMRTEDLLYETQLSHTSLMRVLKEIKAKKLKSRWIPHELTQRQQQARRKTSRSLST